VDFDRVLRKEATTDCVTPSNPIPVPPGSALDIYKLLKSLPKGLGPVVDSMEPSRMRRFQRSDPVVCTATPEAIRAQMGLPVDSTPKTDDISTQSKNYNSKKVETKTSQPSQQEITGLKRTWMLLTNAPLIN
jgi:hypothetical protein